MMEKKDKECDSRYIIIIGVEDFQHVMGRLPNTYGEYERFLHYCSNGVDAQLDLDIIYKCVKDEMMKDG